MKVIVIGIQKLSEQERTLLDNYDRGNKILAAFMPYITAAFVLTMPEVNIADVVGVADVADVTAVVDVADVADAPRSEQMHDMNERSERSLVPECDGSSQEVPHYDGSSQEITQTKPELILSWSNLQFCYPNSSIIGFLQQINATAYIEIENRIPVLHINKGCKHSDSCCLRYELSDVAFKYDIDCILNEKVVEELQSLSSL